MNLLSHENESRQTGTGKIVNFDQGLKFSDLEMKRILSNIIKFYQYLIIIPKLIGVINKGESQLLKDISAAIDDKKIDAITLTINKYLNIKELDKIKQGRKGKNTTQVMHASTYAQTID